jgi:hypothetical protein
MLKKSMKDIESLKEDTIREMRTELIEKTHQIGVLKGRIGRLEADLLHVTSQYQILSNKIEEGSAFHFVKKS